MKSSRRSSRAPRFRDSISSQAPGSDRKRPPRTSLLRRGSTTTPRGRRTKSRTLPRNFSSASKRQRLRAPVAQQQLQGNSVTIGVRLRPLADPSAEMSCVTVCEDGKSVTLSRPERDADKFGFDRTFGPEASQEDVFQAMASGDLEVAMCGYNVTIFAYGQTGSGKTHTMTGAMEGEGRGIIPRSLEQLFAGMQRRRDAGAEVAKITCSYIEIYADKVYDLLDSEHVGHKRLREGGKQGIHVEGLLAVDVQCPEDALELLNRGKRLRKVSKTLMNAESSRSHAIFTVRLEIKCSEALDQQLMLEASNMPGSVIPAPPSNGLSGVGLGLSDSNALESALTVERCSDVNLVDLAGSERQKKTGTTGHQLKEASEINKSLSCLGNVIKTITDPGTALHTPYRDSTLTHLLRESLGGNTRMCMLATLSQSVGAYQETHSTLKFVARAKLIKCRVRANAGNSGLNDPMLVKKLQAELVLLRGQLELLQQAKIAVHQPIIAPPSSQDTSIMAVLSRESSEEVRRCLIGHPEFVKADNTISTGKEDECNSVEDGLVASDKKGSELLRSRLHHLELVCLFLISSLEETRANNVRLLEASKAHMGQLEALKRLIAAKDTSSELMQGNVDRLRALLIDVEAALSRVDPAEAASRIHDGAEGQDASDNIPNPLQSNSESVYDVVLTLRDLCSSLSTAEGGEEARSQDAIEAGRAEARAEAAAQNAEIQAENARLRYLLTKVGLLPGLERHSIDGEVDRAEEETLCSQSEAHRLLVTCRSKSERANETVIAQLKAATLDKHDLQEMLSVENSKITAGHVSSIPSEKIEARKDSENNDQALAEAKEKIISLRRDLEQTKRELFESRENASAAAVAANNVPPALDLAGVLQPTLGRASMGPLSSSSNDLDRGQISVGRTAHDAAANSFVKRAIAIVAEAKNATSGTAIVKSKPCTNERARTTDSYSAESVDDAKNNVLIKPFNADVLEGVLNSYRRASLDITKLRRDNFLCARKARRTTMDGKCKTARLEETLKSLRETLNETEAGRERLQMALDNRTEDMAERLKETEFWRMKYLAVKEMKEQEESEKNKAISELKIMMALNRTQNRCDDHKRGTSGVDVKAVVNSIDEKTRVDDEIKRAETTTATKVQPPKSSGIIKRTDLRNGAPESLEELPVSFGAKPSSRTPLRAVRQPSLKVLKRPASKIPGQSPPISTSCSLTPTRDATVNGSNGFNSKQDLQELWNYENNTPGEVDAAMAMASSDATASKIVSPSPRRKKSSRLRSNKNTGVAMGQEHKKPSTPTVSGRRFGFAKIFGR